jgi:hypothetical protein
MDYAVLSVFWILQMNRSLLAAVALSFAAIISVTVYLVVRYAEEPISAPSTAIQLPTDAEATLAFRNRQAVRYGDPEDIKEIVRLGECTLSSIAQIQCGADFDFNGNGKFQRRTIGFSKTPTGWDAILF